MSGVEESANAAQPVLGAISLGAQVSGSSGGLTWSSDQITYPKDLQSVGKANDRRAHRFQRRRAAPPGARFLPASSR